MRDLSARGVTDVTRVTAGAQPIQTPGHPLALRRGLEEDTRPGAVAEDVGEPLRGGANARLDHYMAFLVGAVVLGNVAPLRGWHKLVLTAWLALFAVPGVWASWRTFETQGFRHQSLDTIERSLPT